ncbi:EF-P lysine aminoacylase GenX [Candidatus Woesebacteria bacterium]|nr:EF-P lysine aminoacylase GenX [Candidatus Woesebacteria bacterium]
MISTWKRLQEHPEKREYLIKRSRIVDAIRHFFKSDGFLEVDTPLLVRSPGTEPYLEVFETQLLDSSRNAQPAYLLTSPEYALKKLLVAGFPKLFSICKSFRNAEGLSFKHNPEFTIMEWYRTQSDYTDIMKDCEALFVAIARILDPLQQGSTTTWTYQGKSYDLTPPWERISVAQAFERYCGIDSHTLLDEKLLKEAGHKRGFRIDADTTWEQVYNQFFLNDIEPHFGVDHPTIIYDFPVSQASLSKKKESDPRFAERFEFYVAGIEMGNAFSELTDAVEQRTRFEAELKERAALGKTAYKLDADYLEAIEAGLPPTGGIAVGIDRIVMFFADAPEISDVVVFPATELWGTSLN